MGILTREQATVEIVSVANLRKPDPQTLEELPKATTASCRIPHECFSRTTEGGWNEEASEK